MLDRVYPWGKLSRQGQEAGWLSLEAHSVDVATAFRGLVAGPVIMSRLRVAAGRPLTPVDVDRLCVLALMHDVGKLNHGFAARIRKGAPPIGHIKPVATILRLEDGVDAGASAVSSALGEAMEGWFEAESFSPLLGAVFSHHGLPLDPSHPDDRALLGEDALSRWRDASGMSPLGGVRSLLAIARSNFPLAWEDGPTLPSAPAFHHIFAGLLMAADWIGSSEDLHPLSAGNDLSRLRAAGFYDESGRVLASIGFDPGPLLPGLTPATAAGESSLHPLQVDILEALGQTLVAEAETGSGKTEAALLRWWRLREKGLVDGLYFALPTRVAAVEIHVRVRAFIERVLGPEAADRVVLAVPGYAGQGGVVPPVSLSPEDENAEASTADGIWAAARPKRFLMAHVAVGTIDQALMAVVRSKHTHMRLASLSRSLLVIDEVHASDDYMTKIACVLLRTHRRLGGHSLLLSATLGAAARSALLGVDAIPSLAEAIDSPYPSLSRAEGAAVSVENVKSSGYRKVVRMTAQPIIDDPEAIAALAVHHAQGGARVLIVRNTVRGAVDVVRSIEGMGASDLLFEVSGVKAVHHGRFGSGDRRLLDAGVRALFGKPSTIGSRILVGTQTLEQSLDIDADILVTDLCPVDVLLQRIGRLHRHQKRTRPTGYGTPAAIVSVPNAPLVDLVDGPAWGLGFRRARSGAGGGVYPDLVVLEGTRLSVVENPVWTVPLDCRRLVEGCLHPEARDSLFAKLSMEDPRWAVHDAEIKGSAFARQSAGYEACWSIDEPFGPWASGESTAALTRLGGRDRRVEIPADVIGPFGVHPGHLIIPHWMAGGISQDDIPIISTGAEGQLDIELGPRRYLYGRHGLEASAT